MAIIRQYHKDTDTVYVYESISYWDAEKGQSRSKRKCIGKIDPATGEMVPTGKRGKKKKESGAASADMELSRMTALYEQEQARTKELKALNSILEDKVASLEKQVSRLRSSLAKISELSSGSLS